MWGLQHSCGWQPQERSGSRSPPEAELRGDRLSQRGVGWIVLPMLGEHPQCPLLHSGIDLVGHGTNPFSETQKGAASNPCRFRGGRRRLELSSEVFAGAGRSQAAVPPRGSLPQLEGGVPARHPRGSFRLEDPESRISFQRVGRHHESGAAVSHHSPQRYRLRLRTSNPTSHCRPNAATLGRQDGIEGRL